MSQENVELVRQRLVALARRDVDAFLALADPEFEWFPPANWPENAAVRGREAIWEFIVELDEPWEEGSYELIELIECGNHKVAAHIGRQVRGKTSGIDAEFENWNRVNFRDRKQLRSAWFATREEALDAAGLEE